MQTLNYTVKKGFELGEFLVLGDCFTHQTALAFARAFRERERKKEERIFERLFSSLALVECDFLRKTLIHAMVKTRRKRRLTTREKHQQPREEEEEEERRTILIKKKKRKKRSKNDSENEDALKAAEVRMCTIIIIVLVRVVKNNFSALFVNLNFVFRVSSRDIFRERDFMNHPPFLDVHEDVSLVILM